MQARHIFLSLLIVSASFLRADETVATSFKLPPVREPAIPSRTLNVTNFGAIADGKTLNSAAIAKAIAALVEQGGGWLIFPPGIWLTGPIGLKSKIELHLEAGALVQFTPDWSEYPDRELDIKGRKRTVVTSPLYGENLEDVAITGSGVFDGAGNAWRPVKRSKLTEGEWKKLVGGGGVLDDKGITWYPKPEAKAFKRSDAKEDYRPVLLKLVNCHRLLLEGVTFQNSPMWNLNPVLCDDVTIRNVNVRNPWFSQNGDGLDLESCRNVVLHGSHFDVGDDGICLKSGMNEEGRRIGVPTENVLIEDCVVYHAHGGVTIGSEMSSGVRNVRVNNCTFIGTDVGLRFKSTRGRGGVVEKIYISNVQMTDIVTDAIGFNMYYGGGGDEAKSVPVSEKTPQFRNIYIRNVTCRGARQAVALQGLPEMPIRGIHLRDVSITAERGIACTDAQDITFDNVEILNRKGAVLNLVNTRDLRADHLVGAAGAEAFVNADGPNNTGSIRHTDLKSARQDFILTGGALRETIKVE
jgi:polygalacturonase